MISERYGRQWLRPMSRWFDRKTKHTASFVCVAAEPIEDEDDEGNEYVVYWSEFRRKCEMDSGAYRVVPIEEFLSGRFILLGPDGKRKRFGPEDNSPEIDQL
jgi:hypothetical protein